MSTRVAPPAEHTSGRPRQNVAVPSAPSLGPGAAWARAVLGPHAAMLRRTRRFLEATWLRQVPSPRFFTPNRVLHETPAVRLRLFERSEWTGPKDSESGKVSEHVASSDAMAGPRPLLIVPPEVNHSNIVDFGPGQSLVAAALAAGFERVAVLHWLSANRATRHRDIDDSVADILDAAGRLGTPVHLVGVCQGGWESAVAAALRPERVATLTLVAAPIDFHAGHGLLRTVSRLMPMGAYRALVATGRGQMPGEFISFGFDALLPVERFWLQPLSVWNRLDDAAWMPRYLRLQDWYRAPKDLPGPLYLRAVRELFKENRLAQGRFWCLGERVDLGRIRCPCCLVAGDRDHITPPPQLLAARDLLGSEQLLEVRTPGGHIGTFMGRHEIAHHWPGIFAWLQEHDPVSHGPGTRSATAGERHR